MSSSSPHLGATSPLPAKPPQFVLIQHASSVPGSTGGSSSLTHPKIEYLYADDPPASVLPRFPGEQVIVLDYDPSVPTPKAQSISSALAVSNVKVTDAPGAVLDDQTGNSKMYIIEALGVAEDDKHLMDEPDEHTQAQAMLARYKQRNEVLRSAVVGTTKKTTEAAETTQAL